MTDIFERHVIARNSFLYFVVATNGAWKCCAIIFGKEYLILSILIYSQKSDRGKLSTRFRCEHFAAGRPALECNRLLMHGEPPRWTLLFLTFSQWFVVAIEPSILSINARDRKECPFRQLLLFLATFEVKQNISNPQQLLLGSEVC